MKLGTIADGRALSYDASLYEFRLDGKSVPYDAVCALEERSWIRWRAPELQSWFAAIDRASMIYSQRVARARAASGVLEVRKEFKSKGGKLAKAKKFELPELPSKSARYEKTGGGKAISVSSAGEVKVKKGAKVGQHTAEVAVRGAQQGAAGFSSIIISVEVR